MLVGEYDEHWAAPCLGCYPYQLASPGIYNTGTWESQQRNLELDPDGVNFWTVDVNYGYLYKFNIRAGSFLDPFSVPVAEGSDFDPIAVYGTGMNSTASFTQSLTFPYQKVGTKSAPLGEHKEYRAN